MAEFQHLVLTLVVIISVFMLISPFYGFPMHQGPKLFWQLFGKRPLLACLIVFFASLLTRILMNLWGVLQGGGP